MATYVERALFLFVPDTEKLSEKVIANPFGCSVRPVSLEDFLRRPEHFLLEENHCVVAGPLDAIKEVLQLAVEHGFSTGLLPTDHLNGLSSSYGIPKQFDKALEVALQKNPRIVDLILCNRKIVMLKATVGRLPLLDSSTSASRLQVAFSGLQRCIGMKLLPFEFDVAGEKKISTAASGCMIVQQNGRLLASRLISGDSLLTDGMISMVISAPMSLMAYFRFLYHSFAIFGQRRKIPAATGYIKSPEITVETADSMDVVIDGEKASQTPLHCEILAAAVRINTGEEDDKIVHDAPPAKKRMEVGNLPKGKEVTKAVKKRIPLFSYASEERFKDLFISLRKDAGIDSSYLLLMLLSTMLAAIGLYQSSSAVVIGAMLLAPLMAPIVSLAMGLLRQDTRLSRDSMVTILAGIVIALSSAMLISLLFPHKPITPEMQARLQPSLLDLGVAIVAGIAGAYTKSNKDILGSLAGVSIAVALVPPLAVAGIGLGMGDVGFFGNAFLLFSTNLIGIILAATLTFRVLGFSPVVRNRRGLILVTILLSLISIPLYLSYTSLVETMVLEKTWEHERFLINDKYLIVQQAEVRQQREHDLLFLRVLTREPLDRSDLNQLEERVQANFSERLHFRVQLIYIP